MLAIAIVILTGCAGPTPAESAARDMEIERAILWEFRKEPAFDRIRVRCRKGEAVLTGEVDSKAWAEKALRRALSAAREWDGAARVRSLLAVRE